ncbi:glycosyltransferase family 2 protein [Empedobacter tilapiae]
MITIFTPTYNRANTLPKLYESLLEQKYKNFEWIIVDDGSTDDTKKIIEQWILESKLKIRYFLQQNGGKHRAINKGVEHAEGELFFIVDSDDYLLDNSLEIIDDSSNLLNATTVAIAFRRQYPDGIVIGEIFRENNFISNHIIKTNILKYTGDLAEVIKTEVIKNYNFPNFPNENFCAESLIWNRIANDGFNTIFSNTPIYVCEYVEGGLSQNSIKNRKKSANYSTLIYKELFQSQLPFLPKLKANINFWRFSGYNLNNFITNLKSMNFSCYNLVGILLGKLLMFKDSMYNNVKINNK